MIRTWQTYPDVIPPADRERFSSLASVLGAPSTPVTRDARSAVALLSLQQKYYVKTFFGPGNRLQYLLRIGRYQRELRNLRYFASLGLATPPLAAHGHTLRWGVLQQAALVTREVTDAPTLKQLMAAGGLYREGVEGARRILEQLADATRALHQRGFYHGDLKARNILVRDHNQRPQLFFFDCPRGHHPPRWRLRGRILRDLAHLDHDLERGGVRRVDRLYLYRRYRDSERLDAEDKALAREALAYYGQRSMTRKRRRRIAAKRAQASDRGPGR